jgi:VTC domain
VPDPLDPLLDRLAPVSLEELDERASLLHRVDHKYVLDRATFRRLVERLADDHEVLDIGGRRRFAYESVYFDTPDLRCFRDHVAGVRPRFKTRIRDYVDSGACVFEVKLRGSDDQTDKRQIEHDPASKDRIGPDELRLTEEALGEVGLAPPDELGPTLTTSFDRITLAARESPARLTCDLEVRLTTPQGAEAQLRHDLVVVETKSEDGRSAADRVLSDEGLEPLGLSKYRTGIALLRSRDPGTDRLAELFEKR